MHVQLTPEMRQEISEQYDDCLCSTCLNEFAEKGIAENAKKDA